MADNTLGEANLRVGVDSTGLGSGLARVGATFVAKARSIGGIAGTALSSAFTVGATAGLAALAGGGVLAALSVKLASDAEEGTSKFKAVFKDATDETIARLNSFADAAGRSRNAISTMASDIGALLAPMGFTRKETGKLSAGVVELAEDLASFNNTSTDEALTALRAGLVGETMPLRRFGVQVSAAKAADEAFRIGLTKTVKKFTELTDTEKARAILSLVYKQTSDAQGDAIRTSQSLANQFKALGGAMVDFGTEVGKVFGPSIKVIVTKLADLTRWATENSGKFEEWGNTLGEITANLIEQFSGFATAVMGTLNSALGSAISHFTGGAESDFQGLLTRILDTGAAISSDLPAAFDLLKTAGKIAFNELGQGVVGVFNRSVSVAVGLSEGLASTMGLSVVGMSDAIAGFGEQAKAIFAGLAAAAREAFGQMSGPLKKMAKLATGVLSPALAGLAASLSMGGEDQTKAITDAFDAAKQSVEESSSAIIEKGQRAGQNIGEKFRDGFQRGMEAADEGGGLLGGVMDGLKSQRTKLGEQFNQQMSDLNQSREEAAARRRAAEAARQNSSHNSAINFLAGKASNAAAQADGEKDKADQAAEDADEKAKDAQESIKKIRRMSVFGLADLNTRIQTALGSSAGGAAASSGITGVGGPLANGSRSRGSGGSASGMGDPLVKRLDRLIDINQSLANLLTQNLQRVSRFA